jgi:MscS family membrane protein
MRTVQLKRHWCCAVVLFACVSCFPQLPGIPATTSPRPTALSGIPTDPLHRETPRRAVLNFLKYAHRGDYATAARYLQLTAKAGIDPNVLARELLTLMDTSLRASIGLVSDLPDGSQDDSSDPNAEVIGQFVVQDHVESFALTRVLQEGSTPIWLVSKATLDRVPILFALAGAPAIDQYLPKLLTDYVFLGVPVGRWMAILLSFAICLSIAWGIIRLTNVILSVRDTESIPGRAHYWRCLKRPAGLVIAIVLHGICVYWIGLPILYRMYYFRMLEILLTVFVAWLIEAILDANKQRILSLGREKREAVSLVQLLHGMGKAALIVVAILVILGVLGFDTKTMVAGLGIGGIALALGAQKTLENLMGGITLVADDVFAIGDECVIDGRSVTILEIGLRSLIVRAREGTQMSFPNGMLAQVGIENVSRREKSLLWTTLVISYETSLKQARCVIARVREMLYSHCRIEQESARFRLTSMTSVGYEMELFAFVQSANGAEVAAIREDIFFRIADIAQDEGAVWAVPSQLTFLSRKPQVDARKETQAAQMVQAWQSGNENPFPDVSAPRLAQLRGTIPYPPQQSREAGEPQTEANVQARQAS